MGERRPLTEQRIVDAAVAVADEGGYAAISMRNVGKRLGVEAMSLYHHIAGKDALLDALVDRIFAMIELPPPDVPWREGMRLRAASARSVLVAHPWALTLIDSRSHPGPALLRHHDAVIGCLRRGGFSIELAAQAFSVIDAYVYGFALTERNLPFDPEAGDGAVDFAEGASAAIAPYPYLAELVSHLTSAGEYRFSDQFEEGLGVILDQLERRLERF
ncbi:TetR/AcrR family transcriptional regulator [Leucobacter ruminantium]|uniref:TetR/AcrR family transcriptional regulator C-terminal domain-containing protein n=1 Tax=Leucobacter ruminantium TaxID=1289170 RepID=A0A939LXN0_9MICO|nr:TetR/AcrR family transcriptional regulator [Leucobacter ruminantium]MBO1806575.1 TetR/AcrR family transcriptional regulator C-terminal domain-containing protein [Leucobacter ruminantium]